jgi:hypothetical protein
LLAWAIVASNWKARVAKRRNETLVTEKHPSSS